MKKIFKFAGYAVLAFLALILVLVGMLVGKSAYKRAGFIKETRALLSAVNAPGELEKLDAKFRPDLIYVRRFSGGEWAAVRSLDEEEVEFGFTAAIIYSSQGRFYISGEHFCGYEGLELAMNGIKADTLAEFIGAAQRTALFKEFRD
jgi:hypothetical protein